MLSLSDNNQAAVIEAFNSTSRYLDNLLNSDNPYFKQTISQIYPTEFKLNKNNSLDTEAPLLDPFTTTGDLDCVAAVERLPALHYSVDFIFLSFGIMGFIVEL